MGFILLSSFTLFGNPIEPIHISEIFIDGDDWQIEFCDFYGYYVYLDGSTFECSAGTTIFNDSLFCDGDETLVISKEDLQTPLSLSQTDDFISIYGNEIWADISWNEVNSNLPNPLPGHSIQALVYSDNDWEFPSSWPEYFLDSQPSIGEEPYMLHSYSTVMIQAFDINNLPLPNLRIEFGYDIYAVTDEQGYLTKNIGSKKYHLEGFYNDIEIWESFPIFYPDSLYQFEIHTDVASSEPNHISKPAYNISNSPNPFNPITTISFGKVLEQPAQVKIYNSKGGLVDELDCASGKECIRWNAGKTASGVYFYKLEIDGIEAGSGKMLLLK